MTDFSKYAPVRLIPFPEPVSLPGGWFRRSWVIRVERFEPAAFLPPPAGGLDIGQLIVVVAPAADAWSLSIDSMRRDDPHDLAYASLVIQRIIGSERETATVDGHLRHPMLNVARET